MWLSMAIDSLRKIKNGSLLKKDEPNFALKPRNTSLNKKETVTNTATNQDLQKIRQDTYFSAP